MLTNGCKQCRAELCTFKFWEYTSPGEGIDAPGGIFPGTEVLCHSFLKHGYTCDTKWNDVCENDIAMAFPDGLVNDRIRRVSPSPGFNQWAWRLPEMRNDQTIFDLTRCKQCGGPGYAYPVLPYEPKSLSVADLYDWRMNPLWKGAAQHLDQLIEDNYAPFAFRCMESRLIPTYGPPRSSALGVLQEWDPIQRELACCATDSQCDVRCPAAAPWYLKVYPIQYAQG